MVEREFPRFKKVFVGYNAWDGVSDFGYAIAKYNGEGIYEFVTGYEIVGDKFYIDGNTGEAVYL